MNELQIRTLSSEPAKIEFNKEQIVKELNEALKKYENLVFTEENTPEIRKVLAELRKGKTAADEYRKSIKKELTAPVTEFEKEIKSITALFDNVIDPLNNQLKEYVERKREEKRLELQEHIDNYTKEIELLPKYVSQIEIDSSFLTQSHSIKTAKESLEFRANNLLSEQNLEKMNQEAIETYVKLKNSEHEFNLSVVAYLSQLEFNDVESVKNTINDDVQSELDRISKEVVEKEVQEKWTDEVVEDLPFEEIAQKDMIDDLPFGNIDESQTEDYTITVTATSDEIDLLEEFLRDNKIKYQTVVKELPF